MDVAHLPGTRRRGGRTVAGPLSDRFITFIIIYLSLLLSLLNKLKVIIKVIMEVVNDKVISEGRPEAKVII